MVTCWAVSRRLAESSNSLSTCLSTLAANESRAL